MSDMEKQFIGPGIRYDIAVSNFSRNITTVVMILCMLLISGAVRSTQELQAKRAADHLTGMIVSTTLIRRSGK